MPLAAVLDNFPNVQHSCVTHNLACSQCACGLTPGLRLVPTEGVICKSPSDCSYFSSRLGHTHPLLCATHIESFTCFLCMGCINHINVAEVWNLHCCAVRRGQKLVHHPDVVEVCLIVRHSTPEVCVNGTGTFRLVRFLQACLPVYDNQCMTECSGDELCLKEYENADVLNDASNLM